MKARAFFLAALLTLCAAANAQAATQRVLRDAETERALLRIGAPIFREAGVSPESVRFVIVDDTQMNAFVAGGQNIFLYTGLILKTRNVQELYGVIAHETGHIALGHLFRMQSAAETLSFQSLLAGAIGIAAGLASGSGGAGMAVMSAGQSMALRGMLGHSRENESAADAAGVRFLSSASLPLAGFASFMEQLKDQELLPAEAQSEYVRTHPLTQDRLDYLLNARKTYPGGTVPAGWDALHARLKAKLLGYLDPVSALRDTGPSLASRYGRAIAYYRTGETPRALALLDDLLKEQPDDPWFLEQKAQVLFEAGRVAESLPPYKKAVEAAPREGLIRAAYGHALLESAGGRPALEEAVLQLNKAAESEPRDPDPRYLLALAYGKLGEEGLSRLNLAERYARLGQTDAAEREARLALKSLKPGSPAALRARDILDIAADRKKTRAKKP